MTAPVTLFGVDPKAFQALALEAMAFSRQIVDDLTAKLVAATTENAALKAQVESQQREMAGMIAELRQMRLMHESALSSPAQSVRPADAQHRVPRPSFMNGSVTGGHFRPRPVPEPAQAPAEAARS